MHAIRPTRLILIASLLFAPALIAQVPTASDQPRYVLPPKNIVDVFDAESLPQTLVNPNRQMVVLTKAKPHPSIAELAQPMYRLAGARINPKNNGPHRATGQPGAGIYSITLKKIEGGAEQAVTLPPQPRVSHVKFSPDGSRLAFLQTKETALELWIADTTTGAAKAVLSGSDRINAAADDPCDWLRDNVTMICELVPSQRGAAPVQSEVPTGPNVHEYEGKPAPAPTYEDLLKTVHDDALFEYYFTSQLAAVNTATAAKTTIGRPAIFNGVTPSPNGDYVLVSRIKRPFSHLMPMSGFPQDVEL